MDKASATAAWLCVPLMALIMLKRTRQKIKKDITAKQPNPVKTQTHKFIRENQFFFYLVKIIFKVCQHLLLL